MLFPADPGLCAQCQHGRQVRSAKGSVFVLCEKSRDDETYPRYPRIPVRQCAGHRPVKREG